MQPARPASSPARSIRDQHKRRLHTADERDELVQGPFPIGEGAGIDLGHRLRGEKDEIPVSRFVGGVLRADVPASTRLVLDDDDASERSCHVLRDQSGIGVGRSARGQGNEQPDGPGRIGLRQDWMHVAKAAGERRHGNEESSSVLRLNS